VQELLSFLRTIRGALSFYDEHIPNRLHIPMQNPWQYPNIGSDPEQ